VRDSSFSTPSQSDCQGTLHPQAVVGLTWFNEGRYFEAHEALELAWRESEGRVRALYQGILQVGVAYYHILRGNYRGALKMLARAQANLAIFETPCLGIDVPALRQAALNVEEALRNLGAERMDALDRRLLQPIPYVTS